MNLPDKSTSESSRCRSPDEVLGFFGVCFLGLLLTPFRSSAGYISIVLPSRDVTNHPRCGFIAAQNIGRQLDPKFLVDRRNIQSIGHLIGSWHEVIVRDPNPGRFIEVSGGKSLLTGSRR